jgi:dolichyl-phosphate beta-glucosyltransferase
MPAELPVLSLILPAYNAAGYLARSLQALLERRPSWPSSELLVVDDGSTDATAAIAAQYQRAGVVCLRLPRNRGKGGAVRTGMLAARGRFRIFTDADLPYELEAIERVLDYLDRKEFDLVIGGRDLPGSRFAVRPTRPRRIASALFTLLISRLVVTGVVDTQCGLKGLRAAAAERLFRLARVDGFAFDVELLYLAYKHNLDIKRIPVQQVRNAPSTLSLPLSSVRMLWDVLLLPLRYHSGGYDLPSL